MTLPILTPQRNVFPVLLLLVLIFFGTLPSVTASDSEKPSPNKEASTGIPLQLYSLGEGGYTFSDDCKHPWVRERLYATVQTNKRIIPIETAIDSIKIGEKQYKLEEAAMGYFYVALKTISHPLVLGNLHRRDDSASILRIIDGENKEVQIPEVFRLTFPTKLRAGSSGFVFKRDQNPLVDIGIILPEITGSEEKPHAYYPFAHGNPNYIQAIWCNNPIDAPYGYIDVLLKAKSMKLDENYVVFCSPRPIQKNNSVKVLWTKLVTQQGTYSIMASPMDADSHDEYQPVKRDDRVYYKVRRNTSDIYPSMLPVIKDDNHEFFDWSRYIAGAKTELERAFRIEITPLNIFGIDGRFEITGRYSLIRDEYKSRCDDLIEKGRTLFKDNKENLDRFERFVAIQNEAILLQTQIKKKQWEGGRWASVSYAQASMLAYRGYYENLRYLLSND